MQFYSLTEINQIQQDLPYFIEVMDWVKDFLAKPHPDLGRAGTVCPFVPHSLKSNSIRLAVIHAKNLKPQQVEEIVVSYRNIFLEIEPIDRNLALDKAFLLIFPDVDLEDSGKLIDATQQRLKLFFVESGLMIGEFHKRNDTPGLHNLNFRPLRSPVPILAIRFMVESDLPFLENTDDPRLRVKYLEAYLQFFGKGIKDETNLKNALQALASTQKQLQLENLAYLEKPHTRSC